MSSRDSRKLDSKQTLFDWVRYSGASISLHINPLHWSWIPRMQDEPLDTWIGPNERRFYATWLMITVRIWIDDGTW